MPQFRSRLTKLAAVLAVVLGVTLTAAPAQGYDIVARSGSPGSQQIHRTWGFSTFTRGVALVTPRYFIWRSPATARTQRVTTTATIYRWLRSENRWVLDSRQALFVDIAAGVPGAWMPIVQWRPNSVLDRFTVNYRVSWNSFVTGRLLGQQTYRYRNGFDYECLVAAPNCTKTFVARRGGVFLAFLRQTG